MRGIRHRRATQRVVVDAAGRARARYRTATGAPHDRNMTTRTMLRTTTAILALSLAVGCGDDTSSTATAEPGGRASTTAEPTTTTTSTMTTVLPPTTTAGGCTAVDALAIDEPSQLHLDLAEWSVTPTGALPVGGRTSVEVTNVGAAGHEVVIVSGAQAADLTIPENSADLSTLPEGARVVGQINAVASGATCAATFDLAPGDYVLLCNIAHGDPGHIERGMVVDLTIG